MPPLFKQILKQQHKSAAYENMLEVRARVQKKVDEVNALKASGLTEREIEQETVGGSANLDFLKEHDRKMKEKANIRREI